MKSLLPVWLGVACCFGGCSSTGVGNPGVATQSLMVSSDSELEPDASDAGEQLDPARLRHAVLVFGELRYLACDTSDEDSVITGPVLVDLAIDRVDPPIADVPIPSSGICGIDATLAPATAPAAMAGRSMFFSGLRNDGMLFLLFANIEGTLRMRPFADAPWPNDGEHGWLWKLRPRRWLTPSELDSAEPNDIDGVNRVIAIDANRYPRLYEAIRSRVAERSSLYIDINDNRRLDPNERSGEALIGQGLPSLD